MQIPVRAVVKFGFTSDFSILVNHLNHGTLTARELKRSKKSVRFKSGQTNSPSKYKVRRPGVLCCWHGRMEQSSC